MSEAKLKGLNTPYDSAFKSIIQKCPRLALFLINEMFYQNRLIPEKYDGTEHVTLLNRELTDLEFGNLEEDIRLKVGTGDRSVFGVIIQHLRDMTEQNIISVYEADTLFEALKIVVEALGERHNAEKEVQAIMGGNVLEFRADQYYIAGKKEGREEGREAGKTEGINQIASLMSKLFSLGRAKDAEKAANDPAYLQQLLAEFGMAKA